VASNKFRERLRRKAPYPLLDGDEVAARSSDDDPDEQEYKEYISRRALEMMQRQFQPNTWKACYRPPAEYDFVVAFWQQELRNGISLVMPNPNGGSFFWFFGNDEGAGYGFHARPNKEGRQPGLIKAQTIHTTVVQVRKGSVRALVDGKELMRLETDFHDLACDDCDAFTIPTSSRWLAMIPRCSTMCASWR
jgi:hypothetical protein